MRRPGKITNLSIFFLALAGIFNLISFALDQQVVQQEDKLREINRQLNSNRSEIETLIFGLNTLEDLGFDVHNSTDNFLDDLDFQTKAVQIFNSKTAGHAIRDKFSKNQSKFLNELYKTQLFKLREYSNKKINDVHKIFVNTFAAGKIHDLLNERKEFKRIQESNNLKISEDIFDEYNFDEETTAAKDDKNFEIYEKFYMKLTDFSSLNKDLQDLNIILRPIYVKKYTDYVLYLEFFSKRKNRKNFFILFSIVSQIMGLTFLLLLFRNLLKANIKK